MGTLPPKRCTQFKCNHCNQCCHVDLAVLCAPCVKSVNLAQEARQRPQLRSIVVGSVIISEILMLSQNLMVGKRLMMSWNLNMEELVNPSSAVWLAIPSQIYFGLDIPWL